MYMYTVNMYMQLAVQYRDQLDCLLCCSRDDVLEELYRRLVEKRRKDDAATSRPKSAAAGGQKRATSVDSEEPYLSDGVVDYG